MLKPPIKWVGGKRQLIPELDKLVPEKVEAYYEPFIGGGALFWHLTATGRFEREDTDRYPRCATINDFNPELANLYTVVRDQPGKLVAALDEILKNPHWNTKEYFLNTRAWEPADSVHKAARLIYLNKTCFNGLYRVNKSGKFNVPFGKFKNPKLYDPENIRDCSLALQHVSIQNEDFETVANEAQEGSFVYFDPPYAPLSATSSFTAYAGAFGLDEQKRLAALYRRLVDRGVKVVLSNSDTPLVHELYAGLDIRIVKARRSVNSDASKRGKINEVLVVNV